VAKASIFLITVALIVGMLGCGSNGGEDGEDGEGDDVGESYTLTIWSADGGVVTVNNVTLPGKAILTYGAGTVVSLIATPDSGYQFVKWAGDVGTIDNVRASETIITIDSNYSVMANFEVPPPIQYRLAIFSTAGGSVTTPGEDAFTYDAGTVVNLVAAPARNYKFVKWTGNVTTIADVNTASTTITMNGNYYVCAHFQDIPCTGA